MEKDTLKEKLSAYRDGELDAEALALVEDALKNDPSHQKDLEAYKKLELETQGLPVPVMTDDAGAALWEIIADQTVNSAGAGAAAVISSEKWSAREAELESAPDIKADRWDSVWQGVQREASIGAEESGIQDRLNEGEGEGEGEGEDSSAHLGSGGSQLLDADFSPTDLKAVVPINSGSGATGNSSFSIWSAVGLMGVAAAVVLAVGLSGVVTPPGGPIGPEIIIVAEDSDEWDEPEAGEQFFSLVKHYPGMDEPVPCFFLKDVDSEP